MGIIVILSSTLIHIIRINLNDVLTCPQNGYLCTNDGTVILSKFHFKNILSIYSVLPAAILNVISSKGCF